MEKLALICVGLCSASCFLLQKNLPQHREPSRPNRPPEENGNGFEGDIILSPEEAADFGIDFSGKGQSRRKRQAVSHVDKLWPNGIIVYTYDDSWANTAISSTAKANMERAMKMWEHSTCLTFRRKTPNTARQVGHSNFVNIAYGNDGCQSAIGRQQYGQDLDVGVKCYNNIGSLAHELAHVAGIFHEHSRPDRDPVIDVYPENVQDNKRQYFDKLNRADIKLSEQYDVESVMHYGPMYFSKRTDPKSPLYTILTKDKHLFSVIGQRSYLSFLDIKTINDLYKCNSRCPNVGYCQHGGYMGPNCVCNCPLGLTGRYCTEVVSIPPSRGCGSVLTGKTGRFSSPGFPDVKYSVSVTCTWLIKGPPGSTITLRFTSFDVEPDTLCGYDHVEVKVYGSTVAGPRFCKTHPPGTIHHSADYLVVRFYSDDDYVFNGFEAQYTIH